MSMLNPQLSADALAQELNAKGFTIGLPESAAQQSTPWFIKAVAMLSGWLAAILLTLFIFAIFSTLFDKPIAMLVIGASMIAGAYMILKSDSSEFLEHLGLAVSIGGQITMTVGLFQLTSWEMTFSRIWCVMVLFHSGLMLLIRNPVHRQVSAFAVAGSLGMWFSTMQLTYLFPVLALLLVGIMVLKEFEFGSLQALISPLGYALAFQFLFPGFVGEVSREFGGGALNGVLQQPWLADLGFAMVLLLVVFMLSQRYALTPSTMLLSLACALLFSLASLKVSGITAGVVVMLLGFAHSNRVLFGLGALSLLAHIVFYYYNLEVTLLYKSASLFAVGSVLLLIRVAVPMLLHTNETRTGGSNHE